MGILEKLMQTYPALEHCKQDIKTAAEWMIACYRRGNKILLCGNGGSASDCEHIVGELMKGFLKCRPLPEDVKIGMRDACPEITDGLLAQLQQALPAISLTGSPSLTTAFSNDVNPDLVFAQQVLGLGKKGDILIGISTSGNAGNVAQACLVARGIGMQVIGLTGKTGGRLKELSDIAIVAPAEETYAIQELHLPIYHALCALVEEHFYKV